MAINQGENRDGTHAACDKALVLGIHLAGPVLHGTGARGGESRALPQAEAANHRFTAHLVVWIVHERIGRGEEYKVNNDEHAQHAGDRRLQHRAHSSTRQRRRQGCTGISCRGDARKTPRTPNLMRPVKTCTRRRSCATMHCARKERKPNSTPKLTGRSRKLRRRQLLQGHAPTQSKLLPRT